MAWQLDLIRHGEVSNPRAILYGRLPRFGLKAAGVEQARATARLLLRHRPTAVFSSPLLRARQTAGEITRLLAGPEAKVSRMLNEVRSPFEGMPGAQVDAIGGDIYTGSTDGFEQPRQVLERLLRFIVRQRRRFPRGPVAAITHGDVIVFGILWALGHPPRPENKPRLLEIGFPAAYPAHASITSFVFNDHDPHGLPRVSYLQP